LAELLGRPVAFAADCIGPDTEKAVAALKPGELLLLENLRFHPGEKQPASEPGFAEALAGLGDLYVNDAFGTAHRAHASMVAVAETFERPSAGFLLGKEIEYFEQALSAPERPFLAILGGAKVSDKITVLEHLLEKVDQLVVGGAMAYTFLKVLGVEVGDSRVEKDKLPVADRILKEAVARKLELLLPIDHLIGREFAEDTAHRVTDTSSIDPGWMGLDIGPRTIETFCSKINAAGTVIWNGPMGVFEWPAFAEGTMSLARACATTNALTIVGGGDSASAAKKSGLADRFDHISTGGGASLELLEGKILPGLAVLTSS
jgi:phosphoglycerate kinase